MNLVVDIGNVQVKTAVFQLDSLVEHFVFDDSELLEMSKKILEKYPIKSCIVSSVKNINTKNLTNLERVNTFFKLSIDLKLPFHSLYKTPKTLGTDRIALTAAAVSMFSNKNVLTIDVGTCITYDFVDNKNNYHGGAISPGIQIRYKSLNYYTSKLPKLKKNKDYLLIGKSTSESIHSGVINGVVNEIRGVISQYEKKIQNLTVVLTGGDAKLLSRQLKSSIFADQNFLLYGLNKILVFNN